MVGFKKKMDQFFAVIPRDDTLSKKGCSLEEAWTRTIAERESMILPLKQVLETTHANHIVSVYNTTQEKIRLCNNESKEIEMNLKESNAVCDSVIQSHAALEKFIQDKPCMTTENKQQLQHKLHELANFTMNAFQPWKIELNNQLAKLSDEQAEMTSTICDIRTFFLTAINDAKLNETVKSDRTCPICFSNEAKMCADPCGHMYCSDCVQDSTRRNVSSCGVCRTSVSKFVRTYFA